MMKTGATLTLDASRQFSRVYWNVTGDVVLLLPSFDSDTQLAGSTIAVIVCVPALAEGKLMLTCAEV